MVVANLGRAKNESELQQLERVGKAKIISALNERSPAIPSLEEARHSPSDRESDSFAVNINDIREERRISVGVEEVIGQAYSQLDFDGLIKGSRKDDDWNATLKATVLARIFDPSSKRRTSLEGLADMGKSIAPEKIYRMMDRLIPFEQEIKQQIFQSAMSLLDFQVDVLFFDVTTLYFESFEEDDLRQTGFSKDAKFKETQVVLALVTNNRGIPLTYEVFAGKKHEGSTLIEIVKKLKASYQIKSVVMVADRAMFSEQNLAFMDEENIKYIVAAKLRSLNQEKKTKILSVPRAEENWTHELELGARRLITSYSVDRAKKDSSQRDKIINKLMKKIKDGKLQVSQLISNAGTKKYIKTDGAQAGLASDKIERDRQWDGLHGVITNFKPEEMSASEVLEKYKGLWKIEEVFRINKTDLKIRPIYHFKSERIRAHILICFIAYTLTAFVRELLQRSNIKLSTRELRRELAKREISILKDKKTQKRYYVPSALTEKQRLIYQAFNLSTASTVVAL